MIEQAIILAAGMGTRLGAMASNRPKPMMPVGGRPILESNVVWLRNAGIKHLYINLHHLPEVVTEHFCNGERFGVEIHYSYEAELLGTAGAVRKIAQEYWASNPSEPFLVIYGDNLLSQFDLGSIVAFHASKGGLATMCLHYRKDVSHSGVALLDHDGRIVQFVEKPSPGQEISHYVNAGIYVLESDIMQYVPEGFSDFSRDVFPKILAKKKEIYGIVANSELVAIDTPEMLCQAREQHGG